MSDFASNASFIAPVVAPYLGQPNKVAMTGAQRANGFVPDQPVAAEHLNNELNGITANVTALQAADVTNLANLTTLIAAQLEGAALSNYTVETTGTSNSLSDIFWDTKNSQFVTVGSAGTILTSPQGREWTSRTSGVATALSGIAANSSILVAVGSAGVIRTSPDGITWTGRTSGVATDLSDVWWQANLSLFIAVGASGVILTSPDGITWTSRTSGLAVQIFVVAGSPTLLVAGASGGAIITSPDGINWTSRTSGIASGIGGAAWKNGLFALCAANGVIITSPDGITWTTRVNGTFGTNTLRGLIATANHFLAVGDFVMLISRDGITWYFADGLSTHSYTEPAWNGRVMVVAGGAGLIFRSHRLLTL